MKVATIRPTTNLGEQSGHAYYNNWKNSVIDYALWQCRVLNVIQTENQYYEYLYEHYAEDKSYVALVKKRLVVLKRKLKKLGVSATFVKGYVVDAIPNLGDSKAKNKVVAQIIKND
jgi:hypothetical protein